MFIRELLESEQFSKVMTHETTAQKAVKIKRHGFIAPEKTDVGIFFNTQDAIYSGGGYGGSVIHARVYGPKSGILDLSDDDRTPSELGDNPDGYEILDYAVKNGYWAWHDDLQFAVVKSGHIEVLN